MRRAARLLLCEDDARFRRGLARLLGAAGLDVVATVDSGERALLEVQRARCDLALVDIELPGIDGVETARRLLAQQPELEVLMLTSFADEQRVFSAMRAGAAGYLVKGRADAAKVADAVDTVLGGGSVIDPQLARRFWNLLAAERGASTPTFELTRDEAEVLELVARGLTNPEAARALGASTRSIKRHLAAVYRKLGVTGRVEASVVAARYGLIEL